MKNTSHNNASENISITTEVKVGKSYKSNGWSLKSKDFNELIPKEKYNGKCHLKINNIVSPARISFGLRLFYSDKNNLKNHLEDLYKIDPNQKIPLELKLKQENLYENIISKYSDSKPLKSINIELFVGKSFKSKGWKMSKEFSSIFIPIKEYPDKFNIEVDKISTKGRLEIGTRLFYKNEELSSYLKKLYEEDENSRINAEIIFDDELIVYDLENNYNNNQLIKNEFRKKEVQSKSSNGKTIIKNSNTKNQELIYNSNYTITKHENFIDAIKNGVNIKAAASIISTNVSDVKNWYIYGKRGIKPFNNFYNDFTYAKKIRKINKIKNESKIKLITLNEYEDCLDIILKGKLKNTMLLSILDILKNYQNKINQMLINHVEEDIDILIELKIKKEEIDPLKIKINNLS